MVPNVVPFSLQLPLGYSLQPPPAVVKADAASPVTVPAPVPADVVSIRDTFDAGTFTAVAGDQFRLSSLVQGHTGTSDAVAGYQVALGNDGGTLLLNGTAITRTSFTADEFAHLVFQVGAVDTRQSLVVVAQIGTRLPDGTLIHEIDSPAVQITADVTGGRSINAMNALITTPANLADANIAGIVQQAGIFTGFVGTTRPTLLTDGNFSAAAGDSYRMGDLFHGGAATGQTIAGYRVALGDGDGALLLNGTATTRTSFTADEFAHLVFQTGTTGTQQSLVVVAQTGVRQTDGTLTREIDSPAVQITADVTGTRSVNAMNALFTVPATTADENVVSIVQQAGIFTGFVGTTRPTLQTDGNFSAAVGDSYRVGDLFHGVAATGQTIAGYRVALGDGDGTLLLNGTATTRTSFTADEFAHLLFQVGSAGTQQSLVVVAQTGILQSDGTLFQEIDSPAVQITADITGSRSINAMNGLTTVPATKADATIASIVQQAGIFTGFVGTTRPTLQTDGNFSAAAGDSYRVGDLFRGGAATGQTIAGYQVALGTGGGTLLLNGTATDRTSFTADEFAHLVFQVGAAGTQQDLVVVAQTGIRQADGTLTREIDSPAVQITADVSTTGSRSINAMNALSTMPAPGADATLISIVQQAGIFTGFVGTTRPTLQTDGNFTAAAGDIYRVDDLFRGSAPTGQAIAGYRVALSAGGGALLLNGTATTRTSFTAEEFLHLTYQVGQAGTQQDLVVVAQTGTRLADGSLIQEIDSPAVQITATVSATGSRSINAMNALSTVPATKADATIASTVQQAGIFTGFVGTTRPALQTVLTPEPPLPLTALAAAIGAYRMAGVNQSATETDLTLLYPTAVGSSVSPGMLDAAGGSVVTALLLLDGAATGEFRTAGDLTTQSEAIRTYSIVKGL